MTEEIPSRPVTSTSLTSNPPTGSPNPSAGLSSPPAGSRKVGKPNGPKWPDKVVVSLRAGGAFFAMANIICVGLLVWAYLQVKIEPKTLAVTGSARKAIVSDRITWSCEVTAKDPDLTTAYETINASATRVKEFLVARGIRSSDITLTAIDTSRRYRREVLEGTGGDRNHPPTIVMTDHVEMYTLTQYVYVESDDIHLVSEASRSVTSLIQEGIEVDSYRPRYLYTKLAELKIDMIAEATKDATTRANQIVSNANGNLGKLVEARLGVMQINPKGSNSTSSEGNNDTSSYEKEIMAVVSTRFEVR
jgi:hypothetical protein